MVTKRHSICLAGLVVAFCVAAAASPGDLAFRAKCQRLRLSSTMKREAEDCPDLARNLSSTLPELQ